MIRLTTHVLDTTHGTPAAGLNVILYHQQGEQWQEITRSTTDTNGRITAWLDNRVLPAGVCKLVFETGNWFTKANRSAFYPVVEVTVLIAEEGHYHIPLLLSPYGYTTYRGS